MRLFIPRSVKRHEGMILHIGVLGNEKDGGVGRTLEEGLGRGGIGHG